MSVSRVVNGSRPVRRETKQKVLSAIERIGYEPNEAARILKGYRARVLGLIVPDLADPFFAGCANSIQETARKAGYMTLMAASGHDSEIEREQVELMVQRNVAGLLVIPSGMHHKHFSRATERKIPVISIDRPLSEVTGDALLVDNRSAARLATEHLIEHGHRRIICVADDEKIFTKIERVAGYAEAMNKARARTQLCLVGPLAGSLRDQLDYFLQLSPPPTAIFATSNLHGIEVLREIQRRSLNIPDNVALITFDEFDAAALVRPSITTIRQPIAELGRQAANRLLKRLAGEDMPESSRIELATTMVIRQSCGCNAPQR